MAIILINMGRSNLWGSMRGPLVALFRAVGYVRLHYNSFCCVVLYLQSNLAPPSSAADNSESESTTQETRVGETEGTGFALGVVRSPCTRIAPCTSSLQVRYQACQQKMAVYWPKCLSFTPKSWELAGLVYTDMEVWKKSVKIFCISCIMGTHVVLILNG